VDAKLGHNPSYEWRNIHASQVIVEGDLIWRLGDSSHIRSWYDPWINDEGRAYVTINVPTGREGMMVREIIEDDTNEWKMDVIKEVFNERHTENILAMPIMDDMGEDKRCWKFIKHSDYMFKSIYNYTMENLVDNSELRVKGNWMKIWSLRIPQKVKVFLWRMVRGCLLMKHRLQTRGVLVWDQCVHSESFYEND